MQHSSDVSGSAVRVGTSGTRWLVAAAEHALNVDGDLRAVHQLSSEAYRRADLTGDDTAMAEAALGLGGLWVQEQRTAVAAATLEESLRHALRRTDPGSPLALRLRARLAAEADYDAGQHAAILAVLSETRRADDALARADALRLAHHCLLCPNQAGLRHDLALELVGVSSRTGRRSDRLMGLLWLSVDLLLAGDPHVERRLAELRELLAEEDHLAIGFVLSAIDVLLAIRAGQLEQAEQLALICAERGNRAGDVDAGIWHGAHLVTIRWYQGRLPELLPLLEATVSSPNLSAVDNCMLAALAVATAEQGDHRRAAGALATLRGRDLGDLPRSSTWLLTMNGVVEAAHLLADAPTAAAAYELLTPYRRLPMIASLGVVCFGSVEHALGVAALTTGDLDRAVEHLRIAVDQNLALGHWPAARVSRERLAEALESGRSRLNPPEPAPATCSRHGRQWLVRWRSHSIAVEHSVGMLHLSVLLANPGGEISAVDLTAGVAALVEVSAAKSLSQQPVLDRTAVREYSQRLSRLRLEVDDLERRGETERAARGRAERDWLVAELSASAGIGGRVRRFPDGTERARVAVGKAIRRAVGRICDADPEVGDHLAASLHTGVLCWYRPAGPLTGD
jgi:hypothetical protein